MCWDEIFVVFWGDLGGLFSLAWVLVWRMGSRISVLARKTGAKVQ